MYWKHYRHPTKRPDVEKHGGVKAGVTTRLIAGLATLGLNLLGATLMITRLALWVAWTETIFLGVLATGATALVLYGILDRFERPAGPTQSKPSDYVRTELLSAETIADLQ